MRLVVGDLRHQLVVLVDELLALQGGQLAQLHVEDGPGLDLVDLQQVHQALRAAAADVAGPDQGDDLVDLVEGLEQARAGCAPAPRPCAAGSGSAGR